MELTSDLILVYMATGVSVLPAVAGWVTWQKSTRPLRLLTIYVSYVGISNFTGVYLSHQGIRNLFLLHLYVLIAIPFLVYIFSELHTGLPRSITRGLIPVIIIIYVAASFGNNEPFSNPPVRSLAIASLLVTFIALYSLFDLLRSPSRESIFSDEKYWISMGSFIYFAGNAFVYSSILDEISINTWTFHNTIHIVSFLMYFGGYKWKRPAFSYS